MAECPTQYPSTFMIKTQNVFGAINIIYAPLIITSNILLITSMISTQQSLKNSSNLLIVCLSVSDCLIGAILMPLQCVENFWYDFHGKCLLKKSSSLLQLYFCGVSMGMTILLAMDRYIHMSPNYLNAPSKLAKLLKRPNIYFTVFATCLLPAVTSVGMGLTIKHLPNSIMLFVLISFIFVIFSTTLVAAMYIRGYLRIRRSVVENPIYANRGELSANESPGYLNALFKTVLILLIAVLISWLPMFAYIIFLASTKFGKNSTPDTRFLLKKVAFVFFNLNSALNALIIFYRNRKSRDWLKRCIRTCGQQSQSLDDSIVI